MNEEQLIQSNYFNEPPDKAELQKQLNQWREIFRTTQSEHAAKMCEKLYKEIRKVSK